MSDHSLDESETRLRLVNPALALAGWSPSQIAEEVVTGRIGRDGTREPGRADYVLHIRGDRGMLPVAVLEVKSESREPDEGIEQAAEYARALSVPHALSTNGREFVSVDLATGTVASRRPLAEFPSPDDLRLDGAELSGSAHIRKRRLSDVEIRDEHGQLVEDRRLQRLIFALWKRGWSDNQDGQQPLGMRLKHGDDEIDVPFAIEFVTPDDDGKSPEADAPTSLYVFGKTTVTQWLKSRPDRVADQEALDGVFYVSDGRYFIGEDQRSGTRTDRLPLSRFPTPEEMFSTIKPKPRLKRLQDLPRSTRLAGESAQPQPWQGTRRSSSREVTRQRRSASSTSSPGRSLDDRTNLVLQTLINSGWGRPKDGYQESQRPVDRSGDSTRQYKLSTKINEQATEIAIVLVVPDVPLRLRHIDQAARLATRDGLRVAFVTNGESYIMRKLRSGLQDGPLPMSLFPDPIKLQKELAGRPRTRSSDHLRRGDRARQGVSISDRPKGFWKRLFGR